MTDSDAWGRFFDKVEIAENGCWLWTGELHHKGYANFTIDGKTVRAHRWYWEQVHGELPEGVELKSTCGNRACVNLEHHQAEARRKSHCPAGHLFDEENTYVDPNDPYQRRQCRECKKLDMRRSRSEKKGSG